MGALPKVVMYRVGSLQTEKWSRVVDDEGALKLLKDRSVKLGGSDWAWHERGKLGKTAGSRVASCREMMASARKAKVGSAHILQSSKGELVVRKIHTKPAIMDTSGTPPVDLAHTAIVQKFPKMHSWGICACRSVAGSSTPSQHSYCNAEDWNGSKSDMQALANYLVRNAKKLNVAHVIYNHRIWSAGVGWHAYDGVNPHTDHCHVDFLPSSPGKSCA